MWAAWTDYEAISHFETKADGEAWLAEQYGPDRSRWPELFEVEPKKPSHDAVGKQYIAVAWWPEWAYNSPPQAPVCVAAWGEEPYVHGYTVGVSNIYRATSATNEQVAIETAKKLAREQEQPVYEEKFSSATSVGMLPVFVKRGITTVDTGWKTRKVSWT